MQFSTFTLSLKYSLEKMIFKRAVQYEIFFCKMAIKVAGSAQKFRVGQARVNTLFLGHE